jgi:2,3-bisphosphoglycerate-dependent phosphoglycerate mutase
LSGADPLDALALSLRRGAAELHLLRHGDAIPASDGAHLTYEDYEAHPLSERGRAQAQALAEHLAALGLAAVYTSPIVRARETAEAIATRSGVALAAERDLREVEIGPQDGAMSLRARLESLAARAIREGTWSGIAGTEPSAAVRARMLRALDSIAAQHPGGRVAIVSHAGAINAVLGAIAGTTHDFVFPLANASISVVRINAGRRLVMSANETAHLR